MLGLGSGLRRLGAALSTRGSARLPLGTQMPKKAAVTTKGRSQIKEPERLLPPLGPMAVNPKGCVTIAIHAKPGSQQQDTVTDLTAEVVNVGIAAPPSEGEADLDFIELGKNNVVLDKGGTSHEKVVKLLASTNSEEILWKF
ncbi:UPF0235 protein C15orf40 [Plecturocebus cupreus]